MEYGTEPGTYIGDLEEALAFQSACNAALMRVIVEAGLITFPELCAIRDKAFEQCLEQIRRHKERN